MPDTTSAAGAYGCGPAGGPWIGINVVFDATHCLDFAAQPAASVQPRQGGR
ncbi:hypothetical protein [Nocardia beijingensis]